MHDMEKGARLSRRLVIAAGAAFLAEGAAAQAAYDGWAALGDGAIVLFRHATAPGVGDPPGHTLGDCASQRNLDEQGRAEARALGAAFRARSVRVGAVRTSRWCRTRETAELAFPGQARDLEAFDSFFGQPDARSPQTLRARAELAAWRAPGVLVVVTHQVNITALTGIFPASAEGIVVRAEGKAALRVVGRIRP